MPVAFSTTVPAYFPPAIGPGLVSACGVGLALAEALGLALADWLACAPMTILGGGGMVTTVTLEEGDDDVAACTPKKTATPSTASRPAYSGIRGIRRFPASGGSCLSCLNRSGRVSRSVNSILLS